jgi:hypothetical protein
MMDSLGPSRQLGRYHGIENMVPNFLGDGAAVLDINAEHQTMALLADGKLRSTRVQRMTPWC